MSKTTKIDKTIDAHEGNVTVGKWSPDGSTLLTGQYSYSVNYYTMIYYLRYKYE